jgi:hypothetical protein
VKVCYVFWEGSIVKWVCYVFLLSDGQNVVTAACPSDVHGLPFMARLNLEKAGQRPTKYDPSFSVTGHRKF